mgnify:CR=1 FL=1
MSIFGGRQPPPDPDDRLPAPDDSAPPSGQPRQMVGFESVLGASSTLRGDLRSQANIRLDGTFEGTLEIDGNILVGETAKITADIFAKNISIAGAVLFVLIVLTTRAFQAYGEIDLLTEGGPRPDNPTTTITYLTYGRNSVVAGDQGLQATTAVLLFVVLLGLSFVQLWSIGKRVHYGD